MKLNGNLPVNLGTYNIVAPEFVYHLYMPIAMLPAKGINKGLRVPAHLQCFMPLIASALWHTPSEGKYVYLTVKKMYVQKGQDANRPGWHIDGYGTDDLNVIWCDTIPTEFTFGEFDLSEDHEQSLKDLELQVSPNVLLTYAPHSLLKLDNTVVHRVAVCKEDCIRTFVKISISKHQYNLEGNSHNHLFDYNWSITARITARNHPIAEAK